MGIARDCTGIMLDYFTGMDIQKGCRNRRDALRKYEPERTSELYANYLWDGLRKAVRYGTLALSAYYLYEGLTDRIPSFHYEVLPALYLTDVLLLNVIGSMFFEREHPPVEDFLDEIRREVEEMDRRNDERARQMGFASWGEYYDATMKALSLEGHFDLGIDIDHYIKTGEIIEDDGDLKPYYAKLRAALERFGEGIIKR